MVAKECFFTTHTKRHQLPDDQHISSTTDHHQQGDYKPSPIIHRYGDKCRQKAHYDRWHSRSPNILPPCQRFDAGAIGRQHRPDHTKLNGLVAMWGKPSEHSPMNQLMQHRE